MPSSTALRLQWSEMIPLTTSGVSRVNAVSGVYYLVYRNASGMFVFYVGQAADLAARLTDHLVENEQNACCRGYMGRYEHFFRCAAVQQGWLDVCERALWERFGGQRGSLCNERIPNVTPANINVD